MIQILQNKPKFAHLLMAFLLCLGLLALNMGFLIDDPDHFLQPDPDCAICQISQTQVIPFTPHIILPQISVFDIIFQISVQKPHTTVYFSNRIPRAPPAI